MSTVQFKVGMICNYRTDAMPHDIVVRINAVNVKGSNRIAVAKVKRKVTNADKFECLPKDLTPYPMQVGEAYFYNSDSWAGEVRIVDFQFKPSDGKFYLYPKCIKLSGGSTFLARPESLKRLGEHVAV